MSQQKEESSFRDGSGFIFYANDQVYRAVNHPYKSQFDSFIQSGLYKNLIEKGLLIQHQEVEKPEWKLVIDQLSIPESDLYAILKVDKIPYISYPYEWCFGQLKDAALLTLQIQLEALNHNLTLKDASTFNVQFLHGKPIFIDTLSFDTYEEGKPWVAYRQFCTHFLAPLALMSKASSDLRRINQLYIDGVPLSLASQLLPFKTRFSPFFLAHIHYHAKLENQYSVDVKASGKISPKLSKNKLIAIISHLISGIESLELPITKSQWGDYYQEFSYTDSSIEHKKQLVLEWAGLVKPERSWDLGCNTGLFSHLIASVSGQVTAFDIDQLAIEKFYQASKKEKSKNILPLVLDLSNPTPAMGWANKERKAFMERGPVNLVLALALIHHLALGNNVPFPQLAEFFSKLTEWLIIEFVPKNDIQSQRLLVTKEDIFDDYHREAFEKIFAEYFIIEKTQTITGTERILYLMRRK